MRFKRSGMDPESNIDPGPPISLQFLRDQTLYATPDLNSAGQYFPLAINDPVCSSLQTANRHEQAKV